MLTAEQSSISKAASPEGPVLNSKVARMLALIDNATEASETARQLARWVLAGDESDDPIDAELSATLNDEDDDAYLNALRRRWPEATEDDITCGHDIAIAVAKVTQSWGSPSSYARTTR